MVSCPFSSGFGDGRPDDPESGGRGGRLLNRLGEGAAMWGYLACSGMCCGYESGICTGGGVSTTDEADMDEAVLLPDRKDGFCGRG